MGGIVKKINKVFSKFLGNILGFESGDFTLSRGSHKITVCVGFCPEKVWISTQEAVADGCGNIPVNKVGCTLLHEKLVFEADIETDSCQIEWFATN